MHIMHMGRKIAPPPLPPVSPSTTIFIAKNRLHTSQISFAQIISSSCTPKRYSCTQTGKKVTLTMSIRFAHTNWYNCIVPPSRMSVSYIFVFQHHCPIPKPGVTLQCLCLCVTRTSRTANWILLSLQVDREKNKIKRIKYSTDFSTHSSCNSVYGLGKKYKIKFERLGLGTPHRNLSS